MLSLLDNRIANRVRVARGTMQPPELVRAVAKGTIYISDEDVAQFFDRPFPQLTVTQQALSDQFWERRVEIIPPRVRQFQ